jgi:hypothetical protein
VVAPIDITALRHERASRSGHAMLAQLRTEAYPVYSSQVYGAGDAVERSFEGNLKRIQAAKSRLSIRPSPKPAL